MQFSNTQTVYSPQNKIRIVTATSLFDGHDASINIMRRILQSSGAEVIHLGHNRSADEIATCAIQEDANAIAVTSYQGGHNEFFIYLRKLLDEFGGKQIQIFGGGGGTILPTEIDFLQKNGVARIYSPDDGRSLGLQGMVNDLLKKSDFSTRRDYNFHILQKNYAIAKALSFIESEEKIPDKILKLLIHESTARIPVIGITGTGGSGKSSLIDEVLRLFSENFKELKIAVLSIDPTKKRTGGALLGDRIRINSSFRSNIFLRSFATKEANLSLCPHIRESIEFLKTCGFSLIIVESAGIGQSDSRITEISDISIYVMTPEYGASTQLEKIDMIDYADFIIINKSDRRGGKDARNAVAKEYQRSRKRFDESLDSMPVFSTISSRFADPGVYKFFNSLIDTISTRMNLDLKLEDSYKNEQKTFTILNSSNPYLAEISRSVQRYKLKTKELSEKASNLYKLEGAKELLPNSNSEINTKIDKFKSELGSENLKLIQSWNDKKKRYRNEFFSYKVREKEININNFTKSLSGTKIPKVMLPNYTDWGDILRWIRLENVPGEFPYTSGVFPFKRTGEDPTRMFAGEGGPERTNRRFHYLSKGMPSVRLSTAFDSVTLYGENPDQRPDIFGKIGNSGVSIASLDDTKRLYSGFNLCNENTSVSMTINGPAPMLLAFFLNTAIDQQCEIYIKNQGKEKEIKDLINKLYSKKNIKPPEFRSRIPEGNDGLGLMLLGVSGDEVLEKEIYENIKKDTLTKIRGTVQADILKEDQAQNTCIFSTEFALKLMGDVQEYFTWNNVRNFYSVSISGYHMAEAGANPITQLAFTLANGFTYVEYYLSRGLKIDDFAPNFSFFFSNGMDPEYSVIGRVARRIWSIAIKEHYLGKERSQMLKYHIQTSGRSLHSQEIEFNDIRTTLQALYAIYDNCNSLHTNAYDEAITTPTEESVRRALAIQLIINKELGLNKNENTLQGSFIIEELTELVEEAVLSEFERISERGGVLGAMETMYQRFKIQEESLYYETLKHSGEYPLIGVNTFLSKEGSPTILPKEVIRSVDEEKSEQIRGIQDFQEFHKEKLKLHTNAIINTASSGKNIFQTLMEASKNMSLAQMTHALYRAGGAYRRNM